VILQAEFITLSQFAQDRLILPFACRERTMSLRPDSGTWPRE
jgi:hypothetical protein